ncbi:glycosyltransferase family 39 protein [Cohnella sp. REN36]|uniref:ArnT family glycosyltransferase n=1 Tax=Cohnella sp. REN36 TaxID=2887347 RepID=UPI001D14C985|nr:glycosyltransferase family 39 protein [Cohnella sp. REN36]MCC3375861.1 glycosyltransferase family 39 protein [Cohnella sp. REN36]
MRIAARKDGAGLDGRWSLAILAAIICLAAFLRLDFITSVSHKVSHDTINYDIMVRQLLEQGVYAYKDTKPNAQVTPGYPLLMAAVYKAVDYRHHDPYPAIRYLQVLMSLANICLIYLLGRKLGGQAVGWIAALAAAIYPPFVWTTGAILTETMAALLFTLYVFLQLIAFERRTKLSALLAGVAMGLTVLTRSEFLILIGASYAFLWLWKRDFAGTLRLLAWTVLGTAIVLSPWVIRNAVSLHELVVASTQVNPFAAGTYPNKNYEDGLVDRHGKTQMEVAKERLRVGFTEHTWTFVKWYTVGKLKYIYGAMFFGSGHGPLYPVIPMRGGYHLLLIWTGLVSTLALAYRWRQPAALLAVLLVVITVTRLAFVPEFRYNFTAMPLIIVIDSFIAVALAKALANLRRPKPAAASETRRSAG